VKLKTVVGALMRSLRDSDIVVTQSEFSRAALQKLKPEGAGAEIVVAGCASTLGEHLGPRDRRGALVIFDSPFEHKHAAEALDFALRYISMTREETLTVTLVGEGAAASLPQARDGRVRRLASSLACDELRELLIRARGVVVSSRYEGFGLPAVEAWSLGTPAVVASCGAAKEVLRGFPGLYEGGSFQGFAASLKNVLAMSQAEIDRFARITGSRHSWVRTGQTVMGAYRRLVTSPACSQD
jgi:glycosyltransferase involved in cell wall biosynthesis